MNIKLPKEFKKIISSPEYVEVRLTSYWRKNKKDVCDWIGPELQAQKLKYELYSKNSCRVFSTDLDNPQRGKGKFKSQLRFNLGYGAMLGFSDAQLGFKIYSQKAFDFFNNELISGYAMTSGLILKMTGSCNSSLGLYSGTRDAKVTLSLLLLNS